MPGFSNTQEIVDAELNGSSRYSSFRKTPTQISSPGTWFDLSMSGGTPVPQYYASIPGVATILRQSTNGGIFHGANQSPAKKVLRRTSILAPSSNTLPMTMILCDYLLYYPFIDEGTLNNQALDNTNTLTRYTNGVGVMVMAVTVASRIGFQTFRFTYTNSDGVAGRISRTVTQNQFAAIGTLCTTAAASLGMSGPFLPLQAGDSGVRSIQSVQMISGTDVGLFTLVLVKPLATTCLVGKDAAVEVDYLVDQSALPEIKDDAYLNYICQPQSSLNGAVIIGDMIVAWK